MLSLFAHKAYSDVLIHYLSIIYKDHAKEYYFLV